MTLEEAAAHIDGKVIYRAPHPGSAVEEGVITSVGQQFVFVRYGPDRGSKATAAAMLELLSTNTRRRRRR